MNDPSNIFGITPIAPPIAKDDSYTVVHDQALTVGGNGVLTNDTSPTGDTLAVAVADGTPQATANGTVTLNSDGSFEYTPNDQYVGTDSFTYSAADGSLLADAPATVTVSITDQAPQSGSNYSTTVNNNPTNPLSAGTPVVAAPFQGGGLAAGDPDADNVTYSLVNADGSALTDSSGNPGDSVTWTVGPGVAIPSQLLVSGNASGRVVLELDVTPGDNNDPADGASPSVFGDICLAGPTSGPAAPLPATSPTTQTQPVTANNAPVTVRFTFRQAAGEKVTSAEDGNASEPQYIRAAGTTNIGPLPMGAGHTEEGAAGNSYVCGSEMIATVAPKPGGLPLAGMSFRWGRTVSERIWNLDGVAGFWGVAKWKEAGITVPLDDIAKDLCHTDTPDAKGRLFSEDAAGYALNNLLGVVGDYIWGDRKFVYSLDVKEGNGDWVQAASQIEYQTFIAKRIALDGTVAQQWQGVQNSYTETDLGLTITPQRIQAIVGGNLADITVPPAVNQPNP